MKKVLIFFSMLLLASNNFAEENLMTENITENSQQPIEQKIVIDVKSVYDSLDRLFYFSKSIFRLCTNFT